MIQNGVMGKIAFFHPILDTNTLLQTTQMKKKCAKLLNWKEKNIKVLKTGGVDMIDMETFRRTAKRFYFLSSS